MCVKMQISFFLFEVVLNPSYLATHEIQLFINFFFLSLSFFNVEN